MYELDLQFRQHWLSTTVWGDLSFPKAGIEKVPAMVISHGSGGVGRNIDQWVEALNEIGVATFVVDSFTPRGAKRTVEDQSLVPETANLVDAFQALALLATHPNIDASKIGIMGFSRGGEVSFRTALQKFRRAVIDTDLKFALHIPIYAGCNTVYWSENLTRAPILNLVGADDDYTHPEPCEALARKYKSAGTPIRSIKYERANHDWDALYPVTFLSGATSGYPCGVIRWDVDPWRVTLERTGETIRPEDVRQYFNSCVTRGVHVGRNERAFRQSRKDVQEFLQSIFFVGK